MRPDSNDIKEAYISIYKTLETIAGNLETQLGDQLSGTPHIDRVTCRVKGIDSFMTKAEKVNPDGSLKYAVPMKEIQDMIGARIIVYYKTDVPAVREFVKSLYRTAESTTIVPDDVTKFGYEGFHMICFIPNNIFSTRDTPLVSNFFELQIKTLQQHAWSQAEHGLGYKPGVVLTLEQQRLLAFLAAQSWAADKALAELVTGQVAGEEG